MTFLAEQHYLFDLEKNYQPQIFVEGYRGGYVVDTGTLGAGEGLARSGAHARMRRGYVETALVVGSVDDGQGAADPNSPTTLFFSPVRCLKGKSYDFLGTFLAWLARTWYFK